MIIMGYDEHYAGGEAGSVSSIGYVENGIKDMLSLVPKEKVINAVPFYTRLWTGSGDNASSRAMGISEATKWVSESGMDLTWDDSAGQYYGRLAQPERRTAALDGGDKVSGTQDGFNQEIRPGRRSRMAAGAGNQRRLGCDWLGVERI